MLCRDIKYLRIRAQYVTCHNNSFFCHHSRAAIFFPSNFITSRDIVLKIYVYLCRNPLKFQYPDQSHINISAHIVGGENKASLMKLFTHK